MDFNINNMETEIVKKDNNTISITKVMPVQFEFTYDYLVQQRANILAQKQRDNTQRDLEIAEIDEYIAQCKTLNITAISSEILTEPKKTI